MPPVDSPAPRFPLTRLRRTRSAPWLRALVSETTLQASDLILPLFVQEGKNLRTPVKTLPGVERLSVDLVVETAKRAASLGIPAVALFPVIDAKLKNETGSEALNPDNLTCRTIRALKEAVPEIGVIADIALDPFTSHGQDGILDETGRIENDGTVEILAQMALVLARAGCDIVAPSDMMDGRVRAIREALETHGHTDTVILAYSAKYASNFYGPFRDAVDSARHLGKADKRTYQMDPANAAESLREVAMDIAEGADMVMVKPAGPYLDIIYRVQNAFSVPVLAYQVSGEYAMLKAAANAGMIAFDKALLESLLGIRRAGASAILTYGALEAAEILK